MNVTLEELSPCKKRVRIEIPANRVQQTYDRIAADYQKEARIPGFRPGHAPKNLVTKKYHKDIEEETQRILMPEALGEVLKENKLVTACPPRLEDKNFVSGVSFVFSAVVEVAPQFTLPQYKGVKLTRFKTEVTETQLNEGIQRLADQQATYDDITDRPAELGDYLVVTYAAFVGEEPLEKVHPSAANFAKATDFWLWTKSTDYIPGFIEPLLGMKLQEERKFDITFGKDAPIPEIVDVTANYRVTLTGLKVKKPVVIDDEFAKTIGATDLENLKTQAKEIMQRENVKRVQEAVRSQVLNILLQGADFPVPESVLEMETESSVRMLVDENQKRGVTVEALEEQREELFKAAGRDAAAFIRLNYIASEIAKIENLQPSNEMVIQHLSAYADGTKQNAKKVLKDLESNGLPPSVSSQITRTMVLEFVVKNAEFVDAEPEATTAAEASTETSAAEKTPGESPTQEVVAVP